MASSLSELCSHAGVASLVLQGDRRQITDRRKVRRGGRRADDVEPVIELDLRAIAIRRAGPTAGFERSAESLASSLGGSHRHRVLAASRRGAE